MTTDLGDRLPSASPPPRLAVRVCETQALASPLLLVGLRPRSVALAAACVPAAPALLLPVGLESRSSVPGERNATPLSCPACRCQGGTQGAIFARPSSRPSCPLLTPPLDRLQIWMGVRSVTFEDILTIVI